MTRFRQLLETGQCPRELSYVNDIKGTGVQFTLQDYRSLAAINRDDLVLFNQAEAQRMKDDAELRKQEADGTARGSGIRSQS